jgi:2-hydroxy-6-oxonona-2,4-dienedioate hydrolase
VDVSALAEEVAVFESRAKVLTSPCGDGDLIIQHWSRNTGSPCVVLVHGGSGSYSHWYRNINYLLEADIDLWTLDLPGLGDSGTLPKGYTADDAVDVVQAGIAKHLGSRPFHLVGFSWGCAVSAQLTGRLQQQIRSLLLVGPAAVGDIPRRVGMQPLIKRTSDMSQQEVFDANRTNLARLMFHRADRIDDMAVYLQTINTNRARFFSPQFARTRLVLDGIAASQSPTRVVYGEYDAPALPDVAGKEALLREARADVDFQIVPDGGHWLQYELCDEFNQLCLAWLNKHE